MIKSGDIYRLIVENVNDLVTVVKKNLTIEYINEEAIVVNLNNQKILRVLRTLYETKLIEEQN